MTQTDEPGPFKKLGYMVVGLAILIGGVRGCSAVYDWTHPKEETRVESKR